MTNFSSTKPVKVQVAQLRDEKHPQVALETLIKEAINAGIDEKHLEGVSYSDKKTGKQRIIRIRSADPSKFLRMVEAKKAAMRTNKDGSISKTETKLSAAEQQQVEESVVDVPLEDENGNPVTEGDI